MTEIDNKPAAPKNHETVDSHGRSPVPASTLQSWYDTVYHPSATALDGKKCAIQPGPDEIAYLESGRSSKGCDYRTFASSGIPALYHRAKATSVYILESQTEGHHKKKEIYSGSGVIVGKRGEDELLVITDNHVVGGEPGSHVKRIRVRTADGVAHDGEVVHRTPTEDLALVAIKIDSKQMSKFEVATALKSLSFVHRGEKVLGLGFPMYTDSLYASPGAVSKIAPENRLTFCDDKTCAGENLNRPMISAKMHSRTGNSGGGVWNFNGDLIGNMDASNGDSIKFALLNPLTQGKIDNMIRQARPWK